MKEQRLTLIEGLLTAQVHDHQVRNGLVVFEGDGNLLAGHVAGALRRLRVAVGLRVVGQ